jgi:AraC-like DNA-binding protein
MKEAATPLNWLIELENKAVDSIGDDFVLIENPKFPSSIGHPIKLNVSISIICLSGTMKGFVNLKSFSTTSPCIFVIIADQIVQFEQISDDFTGLIIAMSNRFTDDLFSNIHERFPLKHSVYDNPWTPLTKPDLGSMTDFFRLLQNTVRMKDNPHRSEIVKNLTRAFFYGTAYQYYKSPDKEKKSGQEIVFEQFVSYVQANYKTQRGLQFYADKLCLTPKYLSKVIKETSGNSASEWIDNYVLLDAKALLVSTNLTIQQISDELNFPSQSFFGKYYKRLAGVSPSEYRKSK